ncbi:hypothetical protein Godav_009514 [Gossypium davidsonii]|uniref:EF-hand domain-containing protein n=2 Tax=Gossypium TaxID=3633 RepID=A0A7J8SDC4_GOSDV|nr:hypothetical protein [Gossypium davidsonii]
MGHSELEGLRFLEHPPDKLLDVLLQDRNRQGDILSTSDVYNRSQNSSFTYTFSSSIWLGKEKMVFFKKSVSPSLVAEHEQILSLFKGCDVNKDGKLSKDEVKAGFRRLQSRFPGFRTQRAFKVADKNGDGFISEAELDELVDYVLDCYEGSVALRLIK